MELKYKTKGVDKHLYNSFNRTFMELKCIKTDTSKEIKMF